MKKIPKTKKTLLLKYFIFLDFLNKTNIKDMKKRYCLSATKIRNSCFTFFYSIIDNELKAQKLLMINSCFNYDLFHKLESQTLIDITNKRISNVIQHYPTILENKK